MQSEAVMKKIRRKHLSEKVAEIRREIVVWAELMHYAPTIYDRWEYEGDLLAAKMQLLRTQSELDKLVGARKRQRIK